MMRALFPVVFLLLLVFVLAQGVRWVWGAARPTVQRSAEEGPVAGGLVPLLAWLGLCVLIFAAAMSRFGAS